MEEVEEILLLTKRRGLLQLLGLAALPLGGTLQILAILEVSDMSL